MSGGDIRNAVLKAAMAAAAEPGSDALKAIHQRHFEEGMSEVLAAKRVMRQSLMNAPPPSAVAGQDLRQRVVEPGPLTPTLVMVTSILALLLAIVAVILALAR